MDSKLTEALREKYPTFFRELYGDPAQTGLALGIECGDGWHNLICLICEQIKELNPSDEFRFTQIKEKLGKLRIYTNGGNDAIYQLLDAVEAESATICQDCGLENSEGIWKAICQRCSENH